MDIGLDTVFFFGIYPYVAIAIMIVGSIIRYDREPYSWRSGSSQLLRRRQLMVGSLLFHLGVLVILGGHLGGLLVPIEVFDWIGIGHGFKQVLAMVAGGVAGVFAIIGATLLVHRRFFDARIRATSSFADNAIILILWVQLALGLATVPLSAGHLDGSEMVKFMSWARGLYTFDLMASSYVEHVHPIFKIHLGLGLTIFLLFPFTRLVHILSAPVRYMWRPGYQIVRTKRRSDRRNRMSAAE
ncbi:MAG: respiratory nitrate reductase subunit gamma [Alphaproteobacteria bacterium]|jgi:nitrate reductase gamma subunit|nr:respiratory nitrate reductase subunit gamma [Alphaproteobacteria bacterium]